MPTDSESQTTLDQLDFRWRAFRAAGREVSPAALCRERPKLATLLVTLGKPSNGPVPETTK